MLVSWGTYDTKIVATTPSDLLVGLTPPSVQLGYL